jgi:hypothetical protein
MRQIARFELIEVETMRPQLPFKPSPPSGRMRMIKMRGFSKKTLTSMLLLEGAFGNADVGLRSDLAFLKGMHAYSIAPYNSGMTPEERYAKIDARLDAIAMNLELTASMAHASDERIGKRLDALLTAVEKDAENIRALARIAEIHEHRLGDLEGGERKN